MGTQYEYKNAREGLKLIYKEEGFFGLFRGARVSSLRIAIGSSVQLATYDTCKSIITEKITYFQNIDNSYKRVSLHFLSAMVSGAMVCLVNNPADVMTTRLYNQNAQNQKYTGIGDCFIKILRVEGISGFYKGLTSHYLRMGPHTVLTFIFFEQLLTFSQSIRNKYRTT